MAIFVQSSHQDLTISSLSGEILALTFTHCYRRDFLGGLSWDENYPAMQDHKFIYDLVGAKDVKWLKINDVVGCWRWHEMSRISNTIKINKFSCHVEATRASTELIRQRGALTVSRRKAAARNIWNNLHAIFELDLKWSLNMARYALELDPGSRPTNTPPWFKNIVNRFPIGAEIAYSFARMFVKKIKYR